MLFQQFSDYYMKHYADAGAQALTGYHGLAGSAQQDRGVPAEDFEKLTALFCYNSFMLLCMQYNTNV